MSAKVPLFTTVQKHSLSDQPILVIDKLGILGEALCKRFSKDSLIVFVSRKGVQHVYGKTPEIIHIPYTKKIPTIPDNTYSYIFIIDHDLSLVKDALPKFLEKAKSDDASLIFAFPLLAINSKLLTHIQDSYKKAKVFIYGDLFGKGEFYKDKAFYSVVNRFIYQGRQFGRIEIIGEGLLKTYPVFLEDAVSGLLEGVFGSFPPSSLFYLFPKNPPSQLSLAHLIQKINPLIRLDFIKEKKGDKKEIAIIDGGIYIFGERYDLGQRIRQIEFDNKMDNQKEEEIYFEEKKGFSYLFRLLFFIAALFLLPFISTFFFSFLGGWALASAKSQLAFGDFENGRNSIHFAKNLFIFAKSTSKVAVREGAFIGLGKNMSEFTKTIDLGLDSSLAAFYFLESQKSFFELISGKSRNPKDDGVRAQGFLKKALILFQKVKAERGVTFDIPLNRIASNTIDLLPTLFGFDEKKTYLVLFQNNMELRPGGGFIGSYGLLTMDKGKPDFSIYDVYDADGQLKGHVEPPYPIRRFLPSVHWYLRDSNFDVDFSKAASASALFLNIEKGQKVDGVIGIDVSFVQNILSVLGPIYVADYKEKVTKDNFFTVTEEHAEKNFFPGSTQKKDFLKALFNAIANHISSKKISYNALLKVFEDSLKEKHFLFAFSQPEVQNLFTVNNWSSSLWDKRPQDKTYIADFLGISEANLSVNKANYFVKRKVSQTMTLDAEGNIGGELAIEYKNNSNAWPGGDYKNYLRIILPLGSTLSGVSFDGTYQALTDAITEPLIYEKKNFVPPEGLEVDGTYESGKSIFGFLTNIKAKTSKTISIRYILPHKISKETTSFSYNLRVFKQPGTDEYPYSFSLSYPKNFKVIEGKPSFSLGFREDLDLLLKFSQVNKD